MVMYEDAAAAVHNDAEDDGDEDGDAVSGRKTRQSKRRRRKRRTQQIKGGEEKGEKNDICIKRTRQKKKNYEPQDNKYKENVIRHSREKLA